MALAHVQTITSAANDTTISATLTLTPGNAVIVTAIWDTSLSGMDGLAQTAGDTLTERASLDDSGAFQQHYSNYSVAGGSTTFTFTWNSAQTARLFVTEISGMATSDAFDQSASATQTVATTHSTGTTGTLSQAAEICIASIHGDASGSTTLVGFSNGFTVPTNGDQLTTFPKALLAYKIVSATDAVETTATTNDNLVGTGLISTYKAAGGGVDPRNDGRILIAPAGFS